MMGQRKFNMKQYHNLSLDDLVSPTNLYRKIDNAIDFSFIYDLAKAAYYKASASVDEASGIITHAQVDEGNKNDAQVTEIDCGTNQESFAPIRPYL